MDGMSSEHAQRSVLPFVAAQPLVDHHCHGILRPVGTCRDCSTRPTAAAAADGTPLRLAGRARVAALVPAAARPAAARQRRFVRRAARRARPDEVSHRRFLGASGLAALCVDTGYTPADLLSPAETASLAGAAAFEVVRLEQVAESLARSGWAPPLPRRVPPGVTRPSHHALVRDYRWPASSRSRRTGSGLSWTGDGRPTGRSSPPSRGGSAAPAGRTVPVRGGAAAARRRGAAPVLRLVRCRSVHGRRAGMSCNSRCTRPANGSGRRGSTPCRIFTSDGRAEHAGGRHADCPVPGVLVPVRPASASGHWLGQGTCLLPVIGAAVIYAAPGAAERVCGVLSAVVAAGCPGRGGRPGSGRRPGACRGCGRRGFARS